MNPSKNLSKIKHVFRIVQLISDLGLKKILFNTYSTKSRFMPQLEHNRQLVVYSEQPQVIFVQEYLVSISISMLCITYMCV